MKRTILLADDQRGIRQFCKQELEAEGFRVVAAEDGMEAVEMLDNCVADVAILDEHMPRCNGLTAAQYIKQSHPDLPIILYTADQDYERYKGPLIDAAVVKSEDLGALMAAISELLGPRPGAAPVSCGGVPAPAGINVNAMLECRR